METNPLNLNWLNYNSIQQHTAAFYFKLQQSGRITRPYSTDAEFQFSLRDAEILCEQTGSHSDKPHAKKRELSHQEPSSKFKASNPPSAALHRSAATPTATQSYFILSLSRFMVGAFFSGSTLSFLANPHRLHFRAYIYYSASTFQLPPP